MASWESPIFQEGTASVGSCSAWPCWSKVISFKKVMIWFKFRFTWCTNPNDLALLQASRRASHTWDIESRHRRCSSISEYRGVCTLSI